MIFVLIQSKSAKFILLFFPGKKEYSIVFVCQPVSLISHLYRFRTKKIYYSLDENVTVKIFNDMQYVNIIQIHNWQKTIPIVLRALHYFWKDWNERVQKELVGQCYTVKKVIVSPLPGRDVTYQTLPGRE
jgi:hypothetical protein